MPTQIYVFVIIGPLVAIFFWWFQRKMVASQNAKTQHNTVGALSPRPGLHITTGDPSHNMTAYARKDMGRGETDVLLQGYVHGVPTELSSRRKDTDVTKWTDTLLNQTVKQVSVDRELRCLTQVN